MTPHDKAKLKVMYMHTMNGEPAAFAHDEGMLCYWWGRKDCQLVPTLKQLRSEQRADKRNAVGKDGSDLVRYGYIRVYV